MLTNIVSKVDVLLAQVLIEGVVLSVLLDRREQPRHQLAAEAGQLRHNTVGPVELTAVPGFSPISRASPVRCRRVSVTSAI